MSGKILIVDTAARFSQALADAIHATAWKRRLSPFQPQDSVRDIGLP